MPHHPTLSRHTTHKCPNNVNPSCHASDLVGGYRRLSRSAASKYGVMTTQYRSFTTLLQQLSLLPPPLFANMFKANVFSHLTSARAASLNFCLCCLLFWCGHNTETRQAVKSRFLSIAIHLLTLFCSCRSRIDLTQSTSGRDCLIKERGDLLLNFCFCSFDVKWRGWGASLFLFTRSFSLSLCTKRQ